MKIKEFIVAPKNSEDTTSCGTTYSGQKGHSAQDIVSQDIVSENIVTQEVDSHADHSAIAEGVSQIFRRKKGGAPKKGFRCTSGPRKGRIVAQPSTCFAKTDPIKSAKIRKKRQQKAKIAGKKLELIFEDDTFKPNIGKQKTEKLVKRDKVDFLTGYIWSHVLGASAPVGFKAGKIVISSNAGHSIFAGKKCNKNFFNIIFNSYSEMSWVCYNCRGIFYIT